MIWGYLYHLKMCPSLMVSPPSSEGDLCSRTKAGALVKKTENTSFFYPNTYQDCCDVNLFHYHGAETQIFKETL